MKSGVCVVLLNTVTTPELEAEGASRDLMRAIQQARRDAGFEVSDRILLDVTCDEALISRLAPFETDIAAETLAVSVAWTAGAGQGQESGDLDGHKFWIKVERATPNA